MTYFECKKNGEIELEKAGIPDPAFSSLALLLLAANESRETYFRKMNEAVEGEIEELYQKLIVKRASGMPLQYITGTAEFYGRIFFVSEDTLIPRFDTEILLKTVLDHESKNEIEKKSVLDLCTGTGIIGITLFLEGTFRKILCSDISAGALKTALKNAEYHKADIEIRESDLFTAIPERFDVIVSNPPYIKASEMKGLEKEVVSFEPRSALFGGEDGLFFYRKIIPGSADHLSSGGHLYLEIGDTQAEAVSSLMKENGFTELQVVRDFNGRDRVVSGRKN